MPEGSGHARNGAGEGLWAAMASGWEAVEGAHGQPSSKGVTMSMEGVARTEVEIDVVLVGWPRPMGGMGGEPTAKADSEEKSTRVTELMQGVEEEELGYSLPPSGPTGRPLLDRPKEVALGRKRVAGPCRREEFSAGRVADFSQGFDLEKEAAVVKKSQFCGRPSKADKSIHQGRVAPA